MNDILEKLAEPFSPEAINWRVGATNSEKTKGIALAYLDARDVQDRLNAVCGPLWQCEHIVSADGKKVTCRIGIKFGDEWIWRSNGAGETDYEAEKGSYSDSFKRAAVLWGVGRYLYDLPSPWVDIQQKGRTCVIADHEMSNLKALLMRKSHEPVGNDNEKPKSARQAHKDDDWKKLAAGLQHCQTAEDVSHYLRVNAPTINRMPDGWRDRWDELVGQTLDRVNARAAA